MEYFNTFGGNPVSCAVGLAVLDVIRDEGLQENALTTGDYLLAGLRDLARAPSTDRDVRGQGLFLGIELVRDRETKEPAATEASAIVEHMKDRGVLLSTTALPQRDQDQAADRVLARRCGPAPARVRRCARIHHRWCTSRLSLAS